MQSQLIKVVVNGEPKDIPSGQSIHALVHSLSVPADRVAVELNQTIVRRRDWEETTVPNGSQIEIVEFVGGG